MLCFAGSWAARKESDMFDDSTLSTEQISEIFSDEIAAAGGNVHDRWDDGSRLFMRSTLPQIKEVARGDGVKGGVAIRASDGGISVHPYTFRLVCTNGAIHARAVQSQQIIMSDEMPAIEAEVELREAIRACCAPEAFVAS